jgi:hypothetical protein
VTGHFFQLLMLGYSYANKKMTSEGKYGCVVTNKLIAFTEPFMNDRLRYMFLTAFPKPVLLLSNCTTTNSGGATGSGALDSRYCVTYIFMYVMAL